MTEKQMRFIRSMLDQLTAEEPHPFPIGYDSKGIVWPCDEKRRDAEGHTRLLIPTTKTEASKLIEWLQRFMPAPEDSTPPEPGGSEYNF